MIIREHPVLVKKIILLSTGGIALKSTGYNGLNRYE